MKKIGVFTSGGDAPGMNAALRAVVRCGIYYGFEVYAIYRGYKGLLKEEIKRMDLRSVSNIVQRGGTIIKTSRSKEFMTDEGGKKAADILDKHGIEGLIAIGGDGTIRGLIHLKRFWKGKCVALPGTIDNDLYGTDYTIGFDTAVNTALDAIDKIRDTADAHERTFIVEVMGREAGFIGLEAGIGGGAEEILIPETAATIDDVEKRLKEGLEKGKTSSLIIVSEGDELGNAVNIANELKKRMNLDFRVCILGHIQRGGNPTAKDRVLASKLGAYAVEALKDGKDGIFIGEVANKITETPLEDSVNKKKNIDSYLMKISSILAL